MFDAPSAMIGIVDGDRTMFRSNIGLGQSDMSRDLSVTGMLVAMGPEAVLVVEDALEDPRTVAHPMVVGPPFLRFFAGVSIRNAEGRAVGAIGVMDARPRPSPTPAEIENLRVLARMASEIVDQADLIARQTERFELLRLAEEMAGVGQWRLDAATMTVTWSDEVYRIHGVERTAFDPSYDDAIGFYHPEDRPRLMAAVARGLNEGVGYRMTLRIRGADGAERLVETQAGCDRAPDGRVTGMFGVFRDVTGEEARRRRLAESETRHRLLAERSTDVIITYGFDGATTYWSPAIEAVTGYRPEELLGRSVADLIHPDDAAAAIANYRVFATTRDAFHQTRRYRVVTKSGDVRWFETRATVTRDPAGRAIEFQDVVRDVTATKMLEDELVEARDRAEAGARAKSEFLANMSHELRTPLTSVIGFAGLLKDSPNLPDQERRHVERIASASDSLLGVINDILDYSKLEAGRVEMEPMPFDLRAMVDAAAAMVEGAASARGTALTLELAPDAPAWLTGDAGRLRQVTLNFLSNAAKFTTDGEIRLCAGWRAGRLRIEVRDTGIGIPAAKMAALFERFAQADASTTRLYGGTGLGLAISRRLIEMMGGEIGAESAPGEGSTFWFEVPAAEAAVPQAAPESDASAPVDLRVLVADDAPANRELVSAILGGLGLRVDVVEDGAKAVEAARVGAYDLILMDVHMPVMDGLDATRAIRASGGATARTPIVALTANVQPEQVQMCRDAGMDAHVGKPIQIGELLAAIAAVTSPAEPEALKSAG
uniref:Histidine kinase n=1 Tax=viral metagenome TaxID=1070528 RepID=A0A6H1ZPH0_9ZZZZ